MSRYISANHWVLKTYSNHLNYQLQSILLEEKSDWITVVIIKPSPIINNQVAEKFKTKSSIPHLKIVHGSTNLPKHLSPKLTVYARALVWEAVKKPHNTSGKLEKSTTQAGESVHRVTTYDVIHKSGLRRRMTRWSYCKKTFIIPVYSLTDVWRKTRRKHVWSDKSKFRLLGLNAKHCLWLKTDENSLFLLWTGWHHAAEKLVKVNGKMDGAKYRAVLKKKTLEDAKDLRWSVTLNLFFFIISYSCL